MLARFERARVVGVGDYEIEGNRYPWVELTQFGPELADVEGLPDRQATGPARFSVKLDAGAALPVLDFGDRVSGWFELSQQVKAIKGTDRAVEQQRCVIVAIGEEVALVEPSPLSDRLVDAA